MQVLETTALGENSSPATFNFNSGSQASGFSVPMNYGYGSMYDDRWYQFMAQENDKNRRSSIAAAAMSAGAAITGAGLQYSGQIAANQANERMNQANIDFQKEENDIARAREDDAIQRRAIDLAKAGLSKTLAAGSPASSQSMTAPSYKFEMKNPATNMASFGVQLAEALANIKYVDSLTKLNNIDASTRLDENFQNLKYLEARAGLTAIARDLDEKTFSYLLKQAQLSVDASEQDIDLKAEQLTQYMLDNSLLAYKDKNKAVSYWLDIIKTGVQITNGISSGLSRIYQ